MAAEYSSIAIPKCQQCGESRCVRKVVTGMPTHEVIVYSTRPDSKIILGCCGMKAFAYYCLECGKGTD